MKGVGRDAIGVMELTINIRIVYDLEMSSRPVFLNLRVIAVR